MTAPFPFPCGLSANSDQFRAGRCLPPTPRVTWLSQRQIWLDFQHYFLLITMIYYCHLIPWYWYDYIISYVHGPWIKTSKYRMMPPLFFLTSNLESNSVSAMLGQWDPMGPIISARAKSTNRRTPRSVAAATKYVKLHGMYRCRHWSLKMCKHV